MSNSSTFARFDLTGRTALVTGASRGIGRGIAIALAEHGADVAIVDRTDISEAAPTIAAIEALGRRAWFAQQDLAEITQLESLIEKLWYETGGIDILVNNAAVAYLHHFHEVTFEQWQQVMNVNLSAAFFLTQQVVSRMVKGNRKGRIINVSSKNGLVAEAGLAPYNVSKGGLELLTQSLAIELGHHGITVNTIAPGNIETEIAGDFDIDTEFFRYYYEHIPLGRFGTVEECVGAVIFLASAAGNYVTGQHIVMDGGVLCQQVPRLQFMGPGLAPNR